MIRKLTTKNGKYNMGLLDYLNQGKQWLQSQPKMADPHANAQALMGGQAMQYNQQPQSLIADTQTPTTNTATPQITPQQQQQVTYGQPVAPNMGQVNQYSSEEPQLEVGGSLGLAPKMLNFQNRVTAPQVGSLLMGSPEEYVEPPEYVTETDETDYSLNSMTPVTTAYPEPPNILGEAFDPSLTEEEIIAREVAKSKLPWYLGGKR